MRIGKNYFYDVGSTEHNTTNNNMYFNYISLSGQLVIYLIVNKYISSLNNSNYYDGYYPGSGNNYVIILDTILIGLIYVGYCSIKSNNYIDCFSILDPKFINELLNYTF